MTSPILCREGGFVLYPSDELDRHQRRGELREAAKKKVPPLVAGPLRKKELFFNFFFILLPFKNKNYFTYRNLSKYEHITTEESMHITLKFVGRYFNLVVTIFPKNRAILVQKLWGEKKLSKSVFGYFKIVWIV